jgi:hypothetical protein
MKLIWIAVNDLVIGVVYRYWNDADGGKSYVGCTINEKKRKYAWNWKNNPYGGEKIATARRKFGLSAFHYEQLYVIYASSKKDIFKKLETLEVKFIEKFDSFYNGYNSNLGGHGSKGRKMSVQQKNKIRKSSRKKPVWLIPVDGSPRKMIESMKETSRQLNVSVGKVYYHMNIATTKSINGYKLKAA